MRKLSLRRGKTADLEVLKNFDNSWRGLPFSPRKISKEEISSLRECHCWQVPPKQEEIECVFMTADVMDEFISYGVFAWDVHDSLWLLECGTVPALEMD